MAPVFQEQHQGHIHGDCRASAGGAGVECGEDAARHGPDREHGAGHRGRVRRDQAEPARRVLRQLAGQVQ